MMIYLSLMKHVLIAAARDKLFISLMALFVCAASLSLFLGDAALIEKDQFSLVFTAFSLRITGVVALTIFVISFLRRSFEDHDIDFLLSRPVGRGLFLCAYASAFALIAILMGLAQAGVLYFAQPFLWGGGHLLWAASIIAENIIMVFVALFFAMILSSTAAAMLSCLGFYVLARMMGQLLGIIDIGTSFWGDEFVSAVMQVISAVMPRLDLLGQSSWLIYGIEDTQIGPSFIVIQLTLFAFVILMAAFIDLIRRDF